MSKEKPRDFWRSSARGSDLSKSCLAARYPCVAMISIMVPSNIYNDKNGVGTTYLACVRIYSVERVSISTQLTDETELLMETLQDSGLS